MQRMKKIMERTFNRYKYQKECIRLSLIYLVIGFLWILFSDRLAYMVSPNKTVLLMINTYKGILYVLVTSAILYLLLRQFLVKVEQSEKENLYLSYNDVLTGLYNRRYYEMEVKRLDTPQNLPISVIMADVNGLKLINDAFGHQLGDQLLQKAASNIRSVCRTGDVLARWGGDEFVALLPHTTYEEAEAIVTKLRELCSHQGADVVERVSVSIGWDTKNARETHIADTLKNAEDAMYKHKIILSEGLRGNIIGTIIKTLYEKNPREEEHSERVGAVAAKLGTVLGFSETQVGRLKLIGHLHDIGKIVVEDGILNKTGKLTEKEQEEVRRHPDVGYRILSSTSEMLDLADCVLAHHERWDGGGYPRGVSGEAIPLEARIIALADSYDAMSSERPYRKALNDDVILYEIKRNAGAQFDPVLAKAFVEKVLKKPWGSDE